MKVLPLGIQTNPVTAPSSYDQTKPFYSSRLAIRPDPISSINAVGVIPNQFYDVFDDTGVVPATGICVTANGRMFISKGFAVGTLTISAYTVNLTTGAKGAWIGDLKLACPAGAITYTLRGLQVDDTNSASMIITASVTHSVVANGGLIGVWGVPITDFVQSSVLTYPAATTVPSLTKTVYLNVDVVGSNTLTTAVGHDYDQTAGGTPANYYVFTGTAALPKIYKFSMASAPSGTVTAGASSSNFTLATGNFTALTGTIISASNSITCGKLGAAHGGGTLSGFACLTYMTSTNIYACKLTDITNGAVTLPSQITTTTSLDVNQFANGFVTPTIIAGTYDQLTDRFYCQTSLGKYLVKQIVNNDPNGTVFGSNDVLKGETGATGQPNELGGITEVSLGVRNGWLYVLNTAVGQRGIVQMDVASDKSNNTSFILSPVMTINKQTCKSLLHYKALAKRSVTPSVGYRTSNFTVDPNAGLTAFLATFTFTNPNTGDLSAVTGFSQVQFITMFTNMGISNTNASQIIEQYLIYSDTTQISDYWEGSVDNSTQSGTSPMYVAFRQTKVYATLPTKFVVYGVDDSGNTAYTFDTVANAGVFSQSNNNGTSWSAWSSMGSFYNAAATTELRVNIASPSGTRLTWSLQEV